MLLHEAVSTLKPIFQRLPSIELTSAHSQGQRYNYFTQTYLPPQQNPPSPGRITSLATTNPPTHSQRDAPHASVPLSFTRITVPACSDRSREHHSDQQSGPKPPYLSLSLHLPLSLLLLTQIIAAWHLEKENLYNLRFMLHMVGIAWRLSASPPR
jgi:hypothetical protein